MTGRASALLGHTDRIAIECGDCGRSRWRKPAELVGLGVSLQTPLDALSRRFSCSSCRGEGLPGKNISVQAWFLHDRIALRAEAQVLRTQKALSTG